MSTPPQNCLVVSGNKQSEFLSYQGMSLFPLLLQTAFGKLFHPISFGVYLTVNCCSDSLAVYILFRHSSFTVTSDPRRRPSTVVPAWNLSNSPFAFVDVSAVHLFLTVQQISILINELLYTMLGIKSCVGRVFTKVFLYWKYKIPLITEAQFNHRKFLNHFPWNFKIAGQNLCLVCLDLAGWTFTRGSFPASALFPNKQSRFLKISIKCTYRGWTKYQKH